MTAYDETDWRTKSVLLRICKAITQEYGGNPYHVDQNLKDKIEAELICYKQQG